MNASLYESFLDSQMSEDWDSVTVIRKRTSVPKVAKTQSALNAARRSNAIIGTEKKGMFVNKRSNNTVSGRLSRYKNINMSRIPNITAAACQYGSLSIFFTRVLIDIFCLPPQSPVVLIDIRSKITNTWPNSTERMM
jgi:hypothetical protein